MVARGSEFTLRCENAYEMSRLVKTLPDPTCLDATPFAALAPDHQRRLVALAQRLTVAGGDTLLREGDPSNRLYILCRGRVGLSLLIAGRPEMTILTLGPGELLGWSALLPDPAPTRVASARALEATDLLVFEGPAVIALCEEDHEIGYAVMRSAFKAVARRLVETRLQVLDVFGRPK